MLKGIVSYGSEAISTGRKKVSDCAKKGEQYFSNDAKTATPPPAPSGSSHGRTVTPVGQATSTPSTHKVSSAPKEFALPATQTPPISHTRTAEPLRTPLTPVPQSSVSKMTSQWEQNSSNAGQPPAPSPTPAKPPYSPLKKTTTYSSPSSNTTSTPPVGGPRPFGSKPLPPRPGHTPTGTSSTSVAGQRPFGSKPVPRPAPAPTGTSAPAITPSRVAPAPSSYTPSPSSLYSTSSHTPKSSLYSTPPQTPAPSSLYSTSSHTPKSSLYSTPSQTPAPSSYTPSPYTPSPYTPSIQAAPSPSLYSNSSQVPAPSLYTTSTPVPSPISVVPARIVQQEPVTNAGKFIWGLIQGNRSRIISLDIKPVCDASGNPIIRGYQCEPGSEPICKLDLVWDMKYKDASGVQKETRFFSNMYRNECLPLDANSAAAKSVFWKTYLSMHGYIETAQGCLNPSRPNPDIWAAPEKFYENSVVRVYSKDIPVGAKTFALPFDLGSPDFKFNLQISNAKQPTFTIINDVVVVPAPVKSKPIFRPLSPAEIAQLTSDPLYPANSQGILKAKWKPNGERDYLGEVEAIYDYLQSFITSLGPREGKKWTKFCERLSWLKGDIERWKRSGLPLLIKEDGKLDVCLGSISLVLKKCFPEEQSKLLSSHLTIKDCELDYILLKNAQGPNMSKYVKKWKKDQGQQISWLVTTIRDGQIKGTVNDRVMALLQSQIPDLTKYIAIYNKTLDSRGMHYSWDLQTYNHGIHAAEMSAWKSRQNQSSGGMVYRSKMIEPNDTRYGAAVRTATRIEQVREYSHTGNYSGGSLSNKTQPELRHYAWILQPDGTKVYPKA